MTTLARFIADANALEDIYQNAGVRFTDALTSTHWREGMAPEIQEREIRRAFYKMCEEFDTSYPELESTDIRDYIRDAARELSIPEEWTD